MNILAFTLILGVLIFVHELGHFLFARLFGIRVDEFGFGYPPRLLTLFYWKGTRFSLNWIPLGGFVKILGENPMEDIPEEEKEKSFTEKPWWKQILVLSGGILFNVLLAWLIFSALAYRTHTEFPASRVPDGAQFEDPRIVVVFVAKEYPAYQAGIRPGDELKEYYAGGAHVIPKAREEDIDTFRAFVAEHSQEEIGLIVYREGKLEDIHVQPVVSKEAGNRPVVGVGLEVLGTYHPTVVDALTMGWEKTRYVLREMVRMLGQLITGELSADALSGPVGIVKEVGKAASHGWETLLSFTAFLSLNLALLNLIPFPALDGGRILIVLIETVTRRKVYPHFLAWFHTIGFFLLLALMVFVTYRDIVRW